MNFVDDTSDFGAPEYAVTGIASIERISIGQVRIAKYSRRKDGNSVLFHEVWDLMAWVHAIGLVEQARAFILAEKPATQQQGETAALH